MKTRWYNGCKTEQDKLERAELYKSCHQVLKLLRSMLESDLEALENKARADAQFELAAWPFYQAKLIGEQSALKNVIDLLPEETN